MPVSVELCIWLTSLLAKLGHAPKSVSTVAAITLESWEGKCGGLEKKLSIPYANIIISLVMYVQGLRGSGTSQ